MSIKTMAILTPGFVPVPAVRGGAIETLITQIIEENEKNPKFRIDVYTVNDEKLDNISYKYTDIIKTNKSIIDNIISLKHRIINKLCRILKINYAIGTNDRYISKLVKNKSYNYILVENNMNIFRIVNRRYKGNSKIIYHLHNSIENDPAKSFGFCRDIALDADLILTASDFLKKQFSKYFNNCNIVTLSNCIDIKQFGTTHENYIKEFKNKYNLNESDFLITYSGRLTKEKGIKELILAMKDVVKKYPKCKLIIVGKKWFGSRSENQYYKELQKIYKSIEKNIIFTGYIEHDRMPIVYNSSHITVVPSLCQEAFGLSALESIACSTPVICTNIGGLPEVVSYDVGRLVDINDDLVNNLKKNIMNLIEDKERNILSQNSRQYVINNFNTPELYFEKFYTEIYKLDKNE